MNKDSLTIVNYILTQVEAGGSNFYFLRENFYKFQMVFLWGIRTGFRGTQPIPLHRWSYNGMTIPHSLVEPVSNLLRFW